MFKPSTSLGGDGASRHESQRRALNDDAEEDDGVGRSEDQGLRRVGRQRQRERHRDAATRARLGNGALNLAKGTIGTAAGKQERSRIETQDPRFETDQ
ncbi:hypothetical protein [Bradyrhizobium zhanjiangense]|uniref:hypothetical protein n=1 Tax=Bradyrhizobium zhanjiangense TaxID=1325107 RepID=UPI001008C367|nr:hypothetical protein [Bradyrhizobium zhanjiangense]